MCHFHDASSFCSKPPFVDFHLAFSLKVVGKIFLPDLHARNERDNRNAGAIFFHVILKPLWETLKSLIRRSFSSHGPAAMRPRSMRSRRAFTRNFTAWP